MRKVFWVRTLAVAAMALLGLTQCRVRENTILMQSVDMRNWSNPVSVTYHNSDTTSLRNLSLTLHVNRLYEEEQIDVEVCMMSPDSLRYTELIALPTYPQWANPATLTTDVEVPYREGVKLRCEGEYIVTITPHRTMRGVEAVGMNFKSNK